VKEATWHQTAKLTQNLAQPTQKGRAGHQKIDEFKKAAERWRNLQAVH